MTDEKSGAQHLVDALKDQGVKTIFSLSGNQIMPVYDALLGSGIRIVHTRHEGAAVYMAEAYAQMTGEVGVALITAGPGFANGLSAMWSAKESQTPILVLSGDAPLKLDGHGAFQEMDQQAGAAAFAKASVRVECAGDMPDATRESMALAQSSTPGPVHMSLLDDVLRDATRPNNRKSSNETASNQPRLPDDVVKRIAAAKRPLVIAGPAFARTVPERDFAAMAKETGIAMLALESPRGMRAPRIGALAEILPEADVVVLLSLAPNFLVGFGNAPPFSSDAHFVCIGDNDDALHRAKQRLGDARMTTVAANSDTVPSELVAGIVGSLKENSAETGWRERVEEAITWRPPEWRDIPADAPPFHATSVAYEVKKFVDANTELSLTIDGGEVGQWCQAILDAKYSIINGPSGAIGGSIPYAMAAKAARPDQPSIALLGDGTAGFYFMEFETAIREDLPIVAIVGNDAKWNAEHQIQVRDYGENRTHSCEMNPTRYDEVAKAMGGYGEHVTDISEMVPAIERAIASGKPACLNVEIQSIAAPVITRK